MQRKKHGNLEWLVFDHLSECKDLVHGIFLKHGGVSSSASGSLNFSSYNGDNHDNVLQNKKLALNALGLKYCIDAKQCHGNRVEKVSQDSPLLECDGLMSQEQDLGLIIRHADCQATIFFDPIQRALAVVHSGWRGSVQNIYRATLLKMKSEFKSRPENILVGISPSLGPQNSEFRHYKNELPESFWPFQVKPTYFNFWDISRMQLFEEGILPHHLEIAEMCTFGNKSDFFSYRREKVITGNHATIAALTTR